MDCPAPHLFAVFGVLPFKGLQIDTSSSGCIAINLELERGCDGTQRIVTAGEEKQLLFADSRWSAIGFAVISPIFLTWMLTFSIGYNRVFSKSFTDRWDAGKIQDLDLYWVF